MTTPAVPPEMPEELVKQADRAYTDAWHEPWTEPRLACPAALRAAVSLAFRAGMERQRALWIEYVKLLGDELEEVIPFMTNRGWVSTRHEKGVELRKKLGIEREGAAE
jgi:hypothetical protein